jgi:hypothetical protein
MGPASAAAEGLRGSRGLPAWIAPVAVGAIALGVCATIAVMDPQTRGALSPGCPFRVVTGYDCPGCGSTRALYALTQGDPFRAIDHNVLVVLMLPVLLWAWFGWLRHRLGQRSEAPTLAPKVTFVFAGVLVGFWVARNLPWEPFTWLGSSAAG